MNTSSPLRKILELGPTAQPVVAGVYAWAVTVAPVGYGKHGSLGTQNWAATVFASLAFVALVRGAVREALLQQDPNARSAMERSRTLTLFSFSAASLVTWICDDDALSTVRLSAARGVAGMVGWALFAYACAAPVVELVPEPARVEAGARARGRIEKGDAVFVGIAFVLAFGLQLLGWSVDVPERAMLVRLTTLGAGVLILGGIGSFVSARHGARLEPSPQAVVGRARVRMARPALPLGWVVALVMLLAAGIFYVLTE